MQVSKVSNEEVRVSVLDALGTELVGTELYTFAEGFVGDNKESKEVLSPEAMSFDVINNEYKLRIIFRNIDYILGDNSDSGIDYNFYVLFATPK